MAEILTLTAAETKPPITTWRVVSLCIDTDGPSVKVEFASNTGERRVWRYLVGGSVTLANVNAAITFINQGRFATQQSKSLQKWLLEQAIVNGVFGTGTVSGTPRLTLSPQESPMSQPAPQSLDRISAQDLLLMIGEREVQLAMLRTQLAAALETIRSSQAPSQTEDTSLAVP